MSIELFFPTAENRRRLHAGPLARDIDGFAVWLSVEGYARPSAREKLRFVELLSRWLESEELGVEDLDEQRVEAFLLARGWSNGRRGEAATGRQLLCYLRGSGVIPTAVPCPDSDTPIDRIGRIYERFLVNERGVSPATVTNYLPIVRTFLTEHFGAREVVLETLGVRDANQFVLRQARRLSRSRAKLVVTVLRSFLRHLYQRGDVPVDLSSAVVPVMHWRLSGLPKALAPEQVEALLESCDRSTATGQRDHAIFVSSLVELVDKRSRHSDSGYRGFPLFPPVTPHTHSRRVRDILRAHGVRASVPLSPELVLVPGPWGPLVQARQSVAPAAVVLESGPDSLPLQQPGYSPFFIGGSSLFSVVLGSSSPAPEDYSLAALDGESSDEDFEQSSPGSGLPPDPALVEVSTRDVTVLLFDPSDDLLPDLDPSLQSLALGERLADRPLTLDDIDRAGQGLPYLPPLGPTSEAVLDAPGPPPSPPVGSPASAAAGAASVSGERARPESADAVSSAHSPVNVLQALYGPLEGQPVDDDDDPTPPESGLPPHPSAVRTVTHEVAVYLVPGLMRDHPVHAPRPVASVGSVPLAGAVQPRRSPPLVTSAPSSLPAADECVGLAPMSLPSRLAADYAVALGLLLGLFALPLAVPLGLVVSVGALVFAVLAGLDVCDRVLGCRLSVWSLWPRSLAGLLPSWRLGDRIRH